MFIIPQALSYNAIIALVNLIREYDASPKLEFEPPVDMDGNPLNFPVSLVSQDSGDQGTVWNNAALGSAALLWETLSLGESRSYADEAGSEKVILTLDSTSGSKPSPKLRWM